MNKHFGKYSKGFTLVEAIVAMTILGIIAGIMAVFIRAPLQGYANTARRVALTDAADGAMRRIRRDIQSALPNSIRGIGTNCIELLPVIAGGRYRSVLASDGSGDILDFSTTDSSFDVLAQVSLSNMSSGNLVAIYNLGVTGADAYQGTSTAAINIASSSASKITLVSSKQFPFESPGKRFHVIEGSSVVYSCSGTTLLRTTQAISSAQASTCPSTGTIVAANVSACGFSYEPASLVPNSLVAQRNGLVSISLALTQDGETVRLYDEVSVSNVP